jgi:hypothetical protein
VCAPTLFLLPLSLFVTLVLAPAPALANWLTNGHFDVDLLGWSTIEPVSIVWDIHDVDADLNSGSMVLTTHPPPMTPGFHGVVSECVVIAPGPDLYAEGWVNITSAQVGPVQAAIGIQQFSSATCQPIYHIHTRIGQIATTLDQWVKITADVPVQPGAMSAQVYIVAQESAGGSQDPTTTQWDAIGLPEPALATGLLAGIGFLASRARRSHGKP